MYIEIDRTMAKQKLHGSQKTQAVRAKTHTCKWVGLGDFGGLTEFFS